MAYCTIDELARALRVAVTADNTPGLTACIDAAAAEIDAELDRDPLELVPSASWQFAAATTAADPGPGFVARDRTNAAATAALYLDPLDLAGLDHYAELLGVRAGDLVRMGSPADDQAFDHYTLTGDVIDRTGWVELPVDRTAAGTSSFAPAQGDEVVLYYLRPADLPVAELALANRVNIVRGVEWAKSNDAAFGVIGFDQAGALQAPRDGFNRHAFELTPLKQHWGLA